MTQFISSFRSVANSMLVKAFDKGKCKKIILTLAVAIAAFIPTHAAEYCGDAGLRYFLRFPSGDETGSTIVIDTTQGAMFTPWFFAGGGIGLKAHVTGASAAYMLVHLDARAHLQDVKMNPFFGARVSYMCPSGGQNWCVNPSVGIRVPLNQKLGMLVSLDYDFTVSSGGLSSHGPGVGVAIEW